MSNSLSSDFMRLMTFLVFCGASLEIKNVGEAINRNTDAVKEQTSAIKQQSQQCTASGAALRL